ncbi:MAG: cation diffusion facilitator family transporter [Desulfotalea sp.]
MKEQENNKPMDARLKAAWISLLVSAIVMACKFAAFVVSGSEAIFSDASESVVNVLAALMALVVIFNAFKPADSDHPYGHGKMEFFSAAFEGGLISFAALVIIVKAVSALFVGTHVEDLQLGMWLLALSGLINLGLGVYLKRVGRRCQSKALMASGAHVLSDLWTSVGIIVGLVLYVLTGWSWVDPVIAIIVALFLVYTGWKIMREAGRDLLDGQDEELVAKMVILVNKHRFAGIIQLHHMRIIRSGNFHHIDAHLVVPEFWDIATYHKKTERFVKILMGDYEFKGEMCLHIDPCRSAYCSVCDLPNCNIRASEFVSLKSFAIEEILSPKEIFVQ